jgi:hypothetical protein
VSAKALLVGGALAALPLLPGCGQSDRMPSVSTYPVKGKVLLADGKPLTRGRIVFHRQEDPPILASGEIKTDGSFELSTLKPGDGAPAGKYGVQIDPTPANQSASAKRQSYPEIPQKYRDDDGLGLFVTIKPEPTELEPFRLK